MKGDLQYNELLTILLGKLYTFKATELPRILIFLISKQDFLQQLNHLLTLFSRIYDHKELINNLRKMKAKSRNSSVILQQWIDHFIYLIFPQCLKKRFKSIHDYTSMVGAVLI